MDEEIKKEVLMEKVINKTGNDLIDYEIPKSEIDGIIDLTIQKTAKKILNKSQDFTVSDNKLLGGLKTNGFCFSVRGFDMKDKFVEVEGIGKCWRKKINKIETKEELKFCVPYSGFFKNTFGSVIELETAKYKWWQTIEKFCKGKPKWLYLVVKVE